MMEDRFPWLAALEVLAKLAAAAGLFAYLLRLGGLRPAAVTMMTVAHVMALSCVMPAPAVFVFATTVTLGTCTYAVLAVDRPWLRAAVVATCFITFGALTVQGIPLIPSVVLLIPLALWTGFLVVIRDWARTDPNSRPNLRDDH